MATSSRERMYRGAAGFADGSVGESRTSVQRTENTQKDRPTAVAREKIERHAVDQRSGKQLVLRPKTDTFVALSVCKRRPVS